MACATWYSNDEPPTMVEPMNGGSSPRYSHSASTDSRLCVVALNTPSTSFKRQAAVVERALDALRHQVDDGHAVRHLAEIGFRDADDRRAAALQAVHHLASAGTNTGQGGSSPPGRCTRKRTRWPIFTCIGSMSSTRLIRRKPSSQSISATL